MTAKVSQDLHCTIHKRGSTKWKVSGMKCFTGYARNISGSICQYKEDGLVSRFPTLFTAASRHMSGTSPGGGGGTQLFLGRGVRPGFPRYGACELTFASENGGLWAENFQIWGLVSWKFPNLGACELKFGENWDCRGLNFQIFSKGGLVNWLFCLKWDPCERQERREKGVFRAAHLHTPFLGQCPPGGTSCPKC